jgi:hypothetical protein
MGNAEADIACAFGMLKNLAPWLCEWDRRRLEREGGGPWPARRRGGSGVDPIQ